jgi:hypothetical protein
MELANVRVTIEYADQNESFAAILPVTGRLLRPLFAANDPAPWWIVALDHTIEYQLKVGDRYQFRLVESGELVIGTREQNRAIGEREPTAVYILLPVSADATRGSDLRVSEFYKAAWGVCRREDAV